MSILSVVVSRKGSKGLPDKGTRCIKDRPLFAYTLDYSLELARLIPSLYTVVSSDSEVIEGYCASHDIPFLKRGPELASDTARLEEVLFEVYHKVGRDFEYISLLYGNIPTRYPDVFMQAYRFLEQHDDYDAVLSMQNVEKYNPAWMFEFDTKQLPHRDFQGYRRQDLRQYMIHDGHTILFRAAYFLSFIRSGTETSFLYEPFGKKIKPMITNRVVIDVDTGRDLVLAEAIINNEI